MTIEAARTPTIAECDELAYLMHYGATDKAGAPYIEHPRRVARFLAPHGQWAVLAGLLHDIVEDTPATLEGLADRGYPPQVVQAVDAVTRRPEETDYLDVIRRAAADPLGSLVKLADNLDNSHPARLAKLGKYEAARLRNKYAPARDLLEAAVREHDERAGIAPFTAVYGPPVGDDFHALALRRLPPQEPSIVRALGQRG